MEFKMTCSCGDTMTIEAGDRDEAVSKFKAMMNEEAIADHMGKHHPGEPLISVADCHAMIEQQVMPA